MGYNGYSLSVDPRPVAKARSIAVIRAAAAVFLLAVSATSSFAGESFGTAVTPQTLTTLRGGDDTNSNNTVLSSTSTQATSATNQNNTIGGDSVAGNANIDSGAFNNMQGMSNVVINTAPMANVQGIMSLNVTLQ